MCRITNAERLVSVLNEFGMVVDDVTPALFLTPGNIRTGVVSMRGCSPTRPPATSEARGGTLPLPARWQTSAARRVPRPPLKAQRRSEATDWQATKGSVRSWRWVNRERFVTPERIGEPFVGKHAVSNDALLEHTRGVDNPAQCSESFRNNRHVRPLLLFD